MPTQKKAGRDTEKPLLLAARSFQEKTLLEKEGGKKSKSLGIV